MVNIDDLLGIPRDEFTGENLHVAREHYQIDVVLPQQRQLLRFRLFLFSLVTGMW